MVQLLLVCSLLASDITSAIKTSATQLTITLAPAGTTKITNALDAGFGADAIGANDANAADNVDIEAGFIVDDTEMSTTDAVSNLVPTYSDVTGPTISSFSSTTAAGSYGIDGKDKYYCYHK